MRRLWSEQDLAEWWQYAERLLTCAIGYPSDYRLDQPRGKMPGHSIVPTNIKIPRHLRAIDRAMTSRYMPKEHRDLLRIKFTTQGKTEQEIADKNGCAYSSYKIKVAKSFEWLDGYFAGACKF